MSQLELIAFIDESCKPVRDRATRKPVEDRRYYVAAAAATFSAELGALRSELTAVTDMIGRPLHYRRLSPALREHVMDAIGSIAGWEAHVYETAQPFQRTVNEHHVRAKLVAASLVDLSHRHGVGAVVFETRNAPLSGFDVLDETDHQVLRRLVQQELVPAELRIRHDSKSEILLSLCDLIAGARTDHLCAVDSRPYAMIGHRVQTVSAIPLS